MNLVTWPSPQKGYGQNMSKSDHGNSPVKLYPTFVYQVQFLAGSCWCRELSNLFRRFRSLLGKTDNSILAPHQDSVHGTDCPGPGVPAPPPVNGLSKPIAFAVPTQEPSCRSPDKCGTRRKQKIRSCKSPKSEQHGWINLINRDGTTTKLT